MEITMAAAFVKIVETTQRVSIVINVKISTIDHMEETGMIHMSVSHVVVIDDFQREIVARRQVNVYVVQNFKNHIVINVLMVILVILIVDHVNVILMELLATTVRLLMVVVHVKPILVVNSVRNVQKAISIIQFVQNVNVIQLVQ
jgi:hypothetical protein